MAVPDKRRPASRSRKEKLVVKGTPVQVNRTWSNEALGVVLLLAAAFVIASVLSQQYYRSAALSAEGGYTPTQFNILGPVGHRSATLLYGMFGWSALVIGGWLLWAGVYVWRHELWRSSIEVRSKALWVVSHLGVQLFAATALFVLAARPGGGSIGRLLGEPLRGAFGGVGAVVVSIALFVLCTAVASRRSVLHVLQGAVGTILFIIGFVFGTVPLALFHGAQLLGAGLRFIGHFLYAAITGMEYGTESEDETADEAAQPPSDPEAEALRSLPKSRAKRRREEGLEAQVDVEQVEEPKTAEPREQFSHVVVSRRKPESAGTDREKLRKERQQSPTPAVEAPGVDPTFPDYVRPDLALLTRGGHETGGEDDEELLQKSRVIEGKLKDFGIQGRITQVHPGPVVTLFEFEPAPGVKVGKIASLQDDLAMSLRASAIRIIAPIPKKGTVGIEVPNKQRDIVRLRDLLESEAFTTSDSILNVPIGKDTYGDAVVADIAVMPHLLMAGSTGTGKSVCINAVLVSLLYRASPAELGLILIDPKVLELSIYEGIPHLRVPVVTVPTQAKAVLQWAAKEMDRRYRMMQKFGVRNIDGYNRVVRGEDSEGETKKPVVEVLPPAALGDDEPIPDGLRAEDLQLDDNPKGSVIPPHSEELKPLSKIVIVIDELADLMLTVGRDIEELITRLAQKARAAGIHLIVATQRPSVDVITGLIKANFPARLSFRVISRIDSRTILDSMGAEKLLGRGDMLLMLPGAVHVRRVHGAFVSDNEVKKVVESIKSSCKPQYDERIMELCEKALQEEGGQQSGGGEEGGDLEYDEFYDKAVELVMEKGQASTSMVQRVFRIGYNRAARIIEMMEKEGIIGPMDGVKPREVLLPQPEEHVIGDEG